MVSTRALAALGIFLWAAAPQAALQFSVTPIGTAEGLAVTPFGVNNFGDATGVYSPAGNGGQPVAAFLYSNGNLSQLPSFGGNLNAGWSINDSGEIAGWTSEALSNVPMASLYVNGGVRLIATPSFSMQLDSSASGINASGQFTGYFNTERGFIAFVATGNSFKLLGTLGGADSEGLSINDAGDVAGYSHVNSTEDHAFLYANGAMEDLGVLPGGTNSEARFVNNGDQVVGNSDYYYNSRNTYQHAFLYSGGVMSDLGTLMGSTADSYAYGINDSGQVVGYSWTSEGYGEHAFIYANGVMSDLNSLLDSSGAGWQLIEATAISNTGYIVGIGLHNGSGAAFLLTPVSGQ